MNEELEKFLKHPAISKAYICQQLYGNTSKTNTGQFANKISGTQNRRFKPEELARLEQIRIETMKDLCG